MERIFSLFRLSSRVEARYRKRQQPTIGQTLKTARKFLGGEMALATPPRSTGDTQPTVPEWFIEELLDDRIPPQPRRHTQLSDEVVEQVSLVVERDARREIVHYGWSWWTRLLLGLLFFPKLQEFVLGKIIQFDRDDYTKRREAERIHSALDRPTRGSEVTVTTELVRHVMPIAHEGVWDVLERRGVQVPTLATQRSGVEYHRVDRMGCTIAVQSQMTDDLIRAFGAVPQHGDLRARPAA